MFRSRFLGAGLLLVMATAACESDPTGLEQAEPLIEQFASDDLESVLTLQSGASDLRGRNDRNSKPSIMDSLAVLIPGFGGLYRTERCAIAVVLTEDADVDAAVRIVHAMIEPLVANSCPDGIRVEPVRGQFTYLELRKYLRASRPLLNMRGVGGSYISFKENRLVILVASRPVAAAVIRALPRVGIPVEAVLFQRGRIIDRPLAGQSNTDRPATTNTGG